MYHIFFIHSSVDEHLHCLHVLAIVNIAAMNIVVPVSFQIMIFSRYMPRSGIAPSSTLKMIVISHSLVFHHPLLLNPVLISVNSPFIILLVLSPMKWILAVFLILEEGALSYCQT